MPLYPTSSTPVLQAATFAKPGPEYRGAPFWSWNCKLDRDRLLRQTGWLAEMGLGGWHIHARTGLDTPYLGSEFMDHVKACVEDGRARGGLRTWLYDEDRWPSGAAGGLVTADPAFRARHLLFTPRPNAEAGTAQETTSCAIGGRSGSGLLLARYTVTLDADGCLASYRRLTDADTHPVGGRIWYAYLETAQPSSWYNGQTYVDTMNPAAIRRFVEVTHEPYRAAVGKDFGGLVPAIFTDEPQFPRKKPLPAAHANDDAVMPWTVDLVDSHIAVFGADPLDTLPEIFWDLPARAPSLARWRFHEHTAERFAAAFADTIGGWCQRHGIAMTGHLMEEQSLESQTHATGESMRSYRGFQIPGIDLLCDSLELTTAKQAQSAKHQYARDGMLSELYGVTDWDFPFAGHKRQGDWQAALGVTVRVHHLSWVSMKGEAKRDYPASIHYQSPWFREYPIVEDHFARLNSVLTRGAPLVRVAVVHPVESYWLDYGPRAESEAVRETHERAFGDIAAWLCFGTIDFDYLAESLLPEQCPVGGASLAVGAMRYDAVVVPPLRTIRATTLERLESFAAAGGLVVFLGAAPALVDCAPNRRAIAFAERCTRVGCNRADLLGALSSQREVAVTHADGQAAGSVLTQLRSEGDQRHLFVCNNHRDRSVWGARIRMRGTWAVRALDTLSGAQHDLPVRHDGGWTEVVQDLPACGHALLSYTPTTVISAAIATTAALTWCAEAPLADLCPVELSEPNVLLLDQAEWRADDGQWQPCEEILRLDNAARRAIGCPEREGHMAQPWSDARPAPILGTVTLRFRICCEAAVVASRLALEDREQATITLDGRPVANDDAGWWVDEDIRLVALPDLAIGEHVLEIARPYRRTSGLEWHYLLGDFGVRLAGRRAVVTVPVRQLAFGDWCQQGLPFYAGNVTYRMPVQGRGVPSRLAVPHVGGPLVRLALDGHDAGRIWLPPWRLDLGTLAAGAHALAITVFGNRRNAFGAVHCRDANMRWWGPGSWRTDGDAWVYEYQLRPMGLLAAPVLETR
jgi:hypothetical protein